MTPLELDPRLTFDTYVIGTSNRMACAAARRVGESPGGTYNPLFIYSASGLGKTHLVTAIGHFVRETRSDVSVVYYTLDQLMEEVTNAIEAGNREEFRQRISEVGLLLVDDVQFLAGQERMQEELLHLWDALMVRRGQVVLASDRPPPEIDGLDERLLSRFSGGLIVDIGVPDYETRAAIIRRKVEDRSQELETEVVEELARTSFRNVRELQGALNRVLAVQELEGRAVVVEEVPVILAEMAEQGSGGEFHEFLSEVTGTVSEVMAGPLPSPPAGYTFETLRMSDELFALRAARAVAEDPAETYNPLFVHGPAGVGKTGVLAAIGNEIAVRDPDVAIAYLDGATFAEELIAALEKNRMEGWRERYRRARILLLDNLDALNDTERAQEELFHLFDALTRAGAQLVFAARQAPRDLTGIEERLRTRLASGLVVELTEAAASKEAPREETDGSADGDDEVTGLDADLSDDWFLDREKVIWDWPYPEDWLIEELE